MVKLICRRLLALPLVLLAIYTIAFMVVAAVPGDAAIGERKFSESALAAEKARLGLDLHPAHRYFWYLGKILRGDLGESSKHPDYTVGEIIAGSLPVSCALGSFSLAIAVVVGVGFGVIAAVRRNRPTDYVLTGFASLGISIPGFVLALLLLIIFVYQLKWFPSVGWGRPEHIVLPSIALAAPYIAYLTRLTRASLLDILGRDFIRTARAKGVKPATVILEHALRNAFPPVLSFLGPAAAGILTGSIVVETVFNIPGVGRHFVNGALNRDWMLVMGLAMTYSTMLVVFNLLVDLGQSALDPKLRANAV